jgi:hypothetical protein
MEAAKIGYLKGTGGERTFADPCISSESYSLLIGHDLAR